MTAVSHRVSRLRQGWLRLRSSTFSRITAVVLTGGALLATSPPDEPMIEWTLEVDGPALTLSNTASEAHFLVRVSADRDMAIAHSANVALTATLAHSIANPQGLPDNTPWVSMQLFDELGQATAARDSGHFLEDASLASTLTFSSDCHQWNSTTPCEAILHITFQRSLTTDATLSTDVAWQLHFSTTTHGPTSEDGTLPWTVEIEEQ
jgi:hypothetical protein